MHKVLKQLLHIQKRTGVPLKMLSLHLLAQLSVYQATSPGRFIVHYLVPVQILVQKTEVKQKCLPIQRFAVS